MNKALEQHLTLPCHSPGMWSSLECSPHPATALFSVQEAAWTKLSLFCTEGAETVPRGVSPRMQGERLLSKGTHSPTCPAGVTNLIHLHLSSQNSKPTKNLRESTRLPRARPVQCFQCSWMTRALFQGCFYGYKLFMLDTSLLQPTEGRVGCRGDLSGLLQLMS